jgi:transcription elongation GreA/GreB family factor
MVNLENNLLGKKQIFEVCHKFQSEYVATLKRQLQQILESANEEKNAVEEGGDSFKEQLQIDREMYNKKLKEAIDNMELLNRIDPNKKSEAVSFGSVVVTDNQCFFVAASLGEVKVNGKNVYVISMSSPIFKAMSGKKKGESFQFMNKEVVIKELY